MQTKPITISKMISVTGISSRSVYVEEWEPALSITPPRDGSNNRRFPERLVANLTSLQTLLRDLEMPLGEFLQIEHKLRLNIPRDEWGMRDLSSDPYWVKYITTLRRDLAEATVDLDELLRWAHELHLVYPLDRMNNICLNRSWIRYLAGVQHKYATEGWTPADAIYLERPTDREPQHAGYQVHSAEM